MKDEIVGLIFSYGGHPDPKVKQWLLNKILETILAPDEYAQFLVDYASDGNDCFAFCWDKGVPPNVLPN